MLLYMSTRLFSLGVVLVAQLLYTASDFIGRSVMKERGFTPATFLDGWFIAYVLLRVLATTGLLYTFSQLPLGKTIILFSVASVLLSNVLGLLFLQEALSPTMYLSLLLALGALLLTLV